MTAKLAFSKRLQSLFSEFTFERNKVQPEVQKNQPGPGPDSDRPARRKHFPVFITINYKSGATVVVGKPAHTWSARRVGHGKSAQTPSFLG